jgi:Tol biopolymer transport system component
MRLHRPATVLVVCTTVLGGLLSATPSEADSASGATRGRIAFHAVVDGASQLFTVWPNGTHLRQITYLTEGEATQADWSPDGRTIAFEYDTADGAQIGFVNANGAHLQLLPPSICIDGQPSYTPDGKRLVYESYDCDVDDAILSRNVDGSDVRRVTPVGPDGATDPNVSPDGRTVAYVEFENGVEFRQALVLRGIGGGNRRQLTPYSFDVGIKVAWSADGQQLAFTKDANEIDGGPLEANVAVINADGTGLKVLTDYHGGRFSAFVGSYSPDGRWLVYRLQDNENAHYELWKMWPDGTHRQRIVDLGGLQARGSDWGVSPH